MTSPAGGALAQYPAWRDPPGARRRPEATRDPHRTQVGAAPSAGAALIIGEFARRHYRARCILGQDHLDRQRWGAGSRTRSPPTKINGLTR